MLLSVLHGDVSSPLDFLFMVLGYVVLLGLMIPFHEAAHAFVAVKLGDATPRWNRRLTLNPLAHYDPFGSLMILLFGIGYAKPVPINPYNFRHRRRDMALTALAGPASNLLLAFVSILLFRLILFACGIQVQGGDILYTQEWQLHVFEIAVIIFMWVLVPVNISLAVFNLLPIPPLDGSKVVFSFLPKKYYWKLMRYERFGILLLLALSYFNVTGKLISGAIAAVYELLINLIILG